VVAVVEEEMVGVESGEERGESVEEGGLARSPGTDQYDGGRLCVWWGGCVG